MWLWNREFNIYINELKKSKFQREDKLLYEKFMQFNNDALVEKFMVLFVERC